MEESINRVAAALAAGSDTLYTAPTLATSRALLRELGEEGKRLLREVSRPGLELKL